MGMPEAAAAKWEPHKAEIERLYLTEDKELKDVVTSMKQEHSFTRSERQYLRQFNQWGFWKKLNKTECEYMDYQGRKRKYENKDTEYVKRGKRINLGQLDRGFRRHLPEGFETAPLTEHGPPKPDGIRLLTPPPASTDLRVELADLPFFRFLRFLRQTDPFRELSLSHKFDQTTIPTDAMVPAAIATSAESKNNLFRFLEAVAIGETKEELHRSSTAIIHGPPVDALFHTISYCAYLSSNYLLPDRNLDKIIQWIVANERKLPLFDILKHDSPTIVIFMRQLLSCATRLGHPSLVHYLLQVCMSFDDPRRIFRCSALLSIAIKDNQVELAARVLDAGIPLKFAFYLDVIIEKDHYEMLEFLLSKGLCSDDTELYDCQSLLEAAVESGKTAVVKLLLESKVNHIDICDVVFFHALVEHGDVAQLLVRFGLNVPIEFDLDYEQISEYMSEELLFFYPVQTPLQVAAQCGNWDLVRCLVEHDTEIDPSCSWVSPSMCKEWVASIQDKFDISGVIPVVSALQGAVRHGNIEMTLFLLQNGAKVDARLGCRYGYTALQIAVATGNKELVNLLLEWKADVNSPAGYCMGSTALQLASGLQDTAIFDILFRRGANVKAEAGRSGKTVLQTAAYAGNTKLVEFLLANRYADVAELPDPNGGRTALQAASESHSSSSLDTVKLLLSKGAVSNEPPARKDGITSLQGAAGRGSIAKARLLLNTGAQIEICSEQYGSTALHKAIENRHFEMVAFLLRHGATPYYGACSVTKRTPLQEACWNGDIQIASLLLSYDFHPVYVNMPASFEGGVTALQAAVESGNLELTRLLLDSGANPNAPGAAIRGTTALKRAILASDFKAAQVLLERGARFATDCKTLPLDLDINGCRCIRKVISDLHRLESIFRYLGSDPVDNSGDDLYAERQDKFMGLISLMMTSGLDITIFPSCLIKTAMGFAIHMGLLRVIDFLLSSRLLPISAEVDKGCTGLQGAALIGSVESVKLFIKHGADVNEPELGPYQGTALQLAARHGHVEVVRYLLEHEAYVAASANCDTALQSAAKNGHAEIVKCLVELGGADIDAPGHEKFGRTALQAAAERSHVDIVTDLLERGADVNAAPSSYGGVTALQAAAISGQARVFFKFLDAKADVAAPGATQHGRTAIEGAAEHGRLEILHMLLQIHPPGQNLADQLKRAEQLVEETEKTEVLIAIQDYRKSRGWLDSS